MGKRLSKEEQWRLEGMKYCLRYLEVNNNDVEALRDELAARGAMNIPFPMTSADIRNYERAVKANMLDCMVTLTLAILHDKWGFGPKRVRQFLDAFMECSDAMENDRLAWVDLQKGLYEECGLNWKIRWYGIPVKQTTREEWVKELEGYGMDLEDYLKKSSIA